MRKIFSIAFLLVYGLTNAQTKYVNEFLNLGVGARGFAMGNAQVASVSDVTSGYWNPAGLRNLPSDFQLSLMHNEYMGGLAKYDYLGVATKLANNKGNIGVNIIRFGVDDIPYTINLVKPDNSIDYTQLTNTFSAVDYAALISYSKDLKPKSWAEKDDRYLTFGANAKIINRSLGQAATAWGVGVDLGIKLQIKRWMLGAVLKDATTTFTGWTFSLTDREKNIFGATGNDLPSSSNEVMNPRLLLGAARNFPIKDKMNLLLEANANVTTDGSRYGNIVNAGPLSVDQNLGAEFSFKKEFFLRAGVNGFQRVKDNNDTTYTNKTSIFTPSAGIGFYVNNLTIDYAYSSLRLQNNPLNSHIISLKLDLRKPKRFRKNTSKKETKS
jgi:hypothetical protein